MDKCINAGNQPCDHEPPVESLDSILCDLHDLGFHGKDLAHLEKLATYILPSNRQAIEAYVENQYGRRCKTKDTHDFPELKDDPLANRCLTCQAWEDFDEYFKDKDEKENTL